MVNNNLNRRVEQLESTLKPSTPMVFTPEVIERAGVELAAWQAQMAAQLPDLQPGQLEKLQQFNRQRLGRMMKETQ